VGEWQWTADDPCERDDQRMWSWGTLCLIGCVIAGAALGICSGSKSCGPLFRGLCGALYGAITGAVLGGAVNLIITVITWTINAVTWIGRRTE